MDGVDAFAADTAVGANPGHFLHGLNLFVFPPVVPADMLDSSTGFTEGNAVTLLSSPSLVVWHFDDFVLDLPRYELRRNGIAIRMEPQVFDVMTQLVSNHQRMVTKNELLDTVWGDRFVGDSALTSRIKGARRALGDDGAAQRYIRTIRGRGYQFVGTIIDSTPSSRPEPSRLPGRLLVGDGVTRVCHDDLETGKTDHQSCLRRSTGHLGARRRSVVSTTRMAMHGPPR
jgi:DNA-binding winged helix-turn-helix (wHTH) protein